MLLDQLKPGMQAEFPGGMIIDWHDRSICRIDRVGPQDLVLNCLVAWNIIESIGIRLYFPITDQYANAVALHLSDSWDVASDLTRNYVQEFVGEVAAAVEHENVIQNIRQIMWPQAIPLQANICDVDSTMNNRDFLHWNDVIRA